MNWENIKIVLDIVGSLAIILSLIYVAKQLRQGTKSLKTSTRDSSFHSLMEWNYYVMSDAELAWIFISGCKDFDSLSEKQKARFLIVMASFFKVFENIYLHFLDQSVDSDVWENNHKIFLAYFFTPGMQLYWKERKLMLHPKFNHFLENISTAEIMPGQDVIDKNRVT